MGWKKKVREAHERRNPEYQSDVTDKEWKILKPIVEIWFGEEKNKRGRPRTVDLREVLNAILYKMHEGILWRTVPGHFPDNNLAYYFFNKIRKSQPADAMMDLVKKVRQAMGREAMPSCAVIDTQSVKTCQAGGPKGHDAGKKV